MFQLGEGVTAN